MLFAPLNPNKKLVPILLVASGDTFIYILLAKSDDTYFNYLAWLF